MVTGRILRTGSFALLLLLTPIPARSQTATLSNGEGDGTVTVTVDPYGTFGSASSAGPAIYDPVGPIGAASTVFESLVFFSPVEDFLGLHVAPADFDATTSSSAASTLTLPGFTIGLTQSLGAASEAGSLLTQAYRIRNDGAEPVVVTLVRHVDGDPDFDETIDDAAGASPDGTAFEFDSGDDPNNATTFVGIRSRGGTAVGYAVQPYPYDENIVGAGGIPPADLNLISGDFDGDRLTDFAYDVTLSLENRLTIGAGETATFTTFTIFGAASPGEAIGCDDGIDNDGDLLVDCADPDCICGCENDADCGDDVACTADQCAPSDPEADLRGCVHRASCPARPCAVGVCDVELGECTFVPGTDGVGCDDGNVCTEGDQCQSGTCTGDPVVDGTPCSDGNSCAADVCVLGQCSESATCEEILVPEVVTVNNVKKLTVVATAEGERGDLWRAQGFVDSSGLTVRVNSQLSVDDAKTNCTSIKPIQEVTNKAKARVGKKGRVKLKLKLNPIGRCLLAASGTGALTVRVEAAITRKSPQTGEPKNELLNRLVRIVRGSSG